MFQQGRKQEEENFLNKSYKLEKLGEIAMRILKGVRNRTLEGEWETQIFLGKKKNPVDPMILNL